MAISNGPFNLFAESISTNQNAYQSTTRYSRIAQNGVDGMLYTYFETTLEYSPWWSVTFQQEYTIDLIVVRNLYISRKTINCSFSKNNCSFLRLLNEIKFFGVTNARDFVKK